MPFDAPEYMQSNAARGLKYLDQGFGGDGLTDGTKREAREMAAGNISDNKVKKMAPWFARHKVDGQASKNSNPSDAQYPGAGLVAWLLWGGDSNFSDRAQNWAQSKIDALDAEANSRSKMKKIERRTFTVQDVEARKTDDGTMRLRGYAAVFNDASVPLPFKETIAPGAFRKTLSETPDVRLLANHQGLPLARTKNGTMTLREDERGLFMDAEIADTNEGRDLWTLVERGDVDQMSFAFRVIRQAWNTERTERTLTEVSLADGDVSVVTYPAYPTTMVEARDAVKKLRFTSDQTSEDMARYAESYDKARSGIAELISLEAQEMADGSDETDSITHLLAAASHLVQWYSGEYEEEGISLPSAEVPASQMPMEEPMPMVMGEDMYKYSTREAVGDFVRWNSSGGIARGKIEKIQTTGAINVPNSSFSINAEDGDPAVLIRVYEEIRDGYNPTDTLVGHKMSELTQIDALPKPSPDTQGRSISLRLAKAIINNTK